MNNNVVLPLYEPAFGFPKTTDKITDKTIPNPNFDFVNDLLKEIQKVLVENQVLKKKDIIDP